MNKYRTHNCSDLSEKDIEKKVSISGWLHRKRDHGNLLFIDLRDHYGITQCVIENNSEYFTILEKTKPESVLKVTGKVVKREKNTQNLDIKTGKIEISIEKVEILSNAKELPIPVFGEQDYPEDIRLKYRFLDLRRDEMHKNIILRSKVISFIRSEMLKLGFLEYQTPILTSSSPEGARDFLVPSRLNPGKFYALPQAPQQFKQLIMVSGFDKYFQIAPCFRDEDARADRSPGEFYQLDLEMSFVEQEDIFNVVETLLKKVFKNFSSKKILSESFPRISYKESLEKYGTDKPDLRNPLQIKDITKIFTREEIVDALLGNHGEDERGHEYHDNPEIFGAIRAIVERWPQPKDPIVGRSLNNIKSTLKVRVEKLPTPEQSVKRAIIAASSKGLIKHQKSLY